MKCVKVKIEAIVVLQRLKVKLLTTFQRWMSLVVLHVRRKPISPTRCPQTGSRRQRSNLGRAGEQVERYLT